ncbi:MAG: ABC transporter ATP-binding protein/permease [Gemmatimonadota bacterium]|nr:ABC transporter ATP-binding protein/permease [Gemmatimonadota bacterium]
MSDKKTDKKKVRLRDVREEARDLIIAQKGPLGLGLVLMVIGRLAGFVLPASSKFVIDDVIGDGRADLLVPIAVAAGVATLVQAASSFGLAKIVSVAAQRAIRDMRTSVQAHVMRLPVSYFDETKSGTLITRIMNDAEGIRNLVGTGIIHLVGGLTTAVLALGVLLWLNWAMTIGAIALLLAFAVMIGWSMKKLRPIFRERWEIHSQVTGRLGEALGGVRLLKVYVAEERERGIFHEGVDRLFQTIARTITGTSAVSAFSTVVVGTISVLIMIVGGRAIIAGTMTLGDLVMYIFFVGLMVAPLVQIANIGTQLSEAFAGLDRIREIRSMPTEDAEDAAREPAAELAGEVAFEGVDFEYEADTPVLKDVSFHAPAGTTTALVGPSGAGKSTLINLVMAFARPKSGRILVDGHDLDTLRLRDYRRQLGVVMQDNFLFDGTVSENIAFADPDASEEEIKAAARVAHCDEFIERFEDQYDTVVGERGVKLSGGQRQRVAIARAILADPRVLILDEATSSLDSESEALIRDGLRSLREGRTTFVIAHRLSTIQSADQILVLDGGRVVERGTHGELVANEAGLYRRLYEKQRLLVEDAYVNPGEDPIPESERPSAEQDEDQAIASMSRRL